ncbi:MAG: hypothetical protein KAW90_03015 [Dehalococcoidales bacterium]|nr:hypothetical protein [Dehalococcoidales bacterium]
MPKIDSEKYFVEKPAYEVTPTVEVKSRHPAMTLMSNNLVPGADMYVEAGWVCDMPDPPTHIYEHTHDYDEIVIHMGVDPDNREELGGEVELWIDGKQNILNRSFIAFVPAGIKHCPLKINRVDRPIFHFTSGMSRTYQ